MNKDQKKAYNDLLEEMFITYERLAQVPVRESAEPMAPLSKTNIAVCAKAALISLSSGEEIYVREGVARKLALAQEKLESLWPGHRLEVVYGYRSPAVQKESFEKIKAELGFAGQPETPAIRKAAHKFVAFPEVAGHPTGGAVDIRILGPKGQIIDMGTGIHVLEESSFTFSPFVSPEVWQNRQILRICMTSAGFAPFDGEWWHFSYGDREWAAYYRQPHSLYGLAELPAKARKAA
jgi:zinc D-Ala-D-Ala dipeptidase